MKILKKKITTSIAEHPSHWVGRVEGSMARDGDAFDNRFKILLTGDRFVSIAPTTRLPCAPPCLRGACPFVVYKPRALALFMGRAARAGRGTRVRRRQRQPEGHVNKAVAVCYAAAAVLVVFAVTGTLSVAKARGAAAVCSIRVAAVRGGVAQIATRT